MPIPQSKENSTHQGLEEANTRTVQIHKYFLKINHPKDSMCGHHYLALFKISSYAWLIQKLAHICLSPKIGSKHTIDFNLGYSQQGNCLVSYIYK